MKRNLPRVCSPSTFDSLRARGHRLRLPALFVLATFLSAIGSGCSAPTQTRDNRADSDDPTSTLGSDLASTVTIGVTTVLTAADNGNAGLLLAQKASLTQAATIQSLSFFVTTAAGSLTLGVYDATGGGEGPGALLAHTASFAAVSGWNTQPVTTPVVLAPGTYWLSYLPSSNSLSFVKETSSGSADWRSFAYGPMPSPFGTPQTSNSVVNWSLYATLTASGSSDGGSSNGGADASAPPAVATAASATPNPVTGTSTNLSVLGSDPAGEATLAYTWTSTGPASVTFSANGTNGAKNVTATFATPGSYPLTATISDARGQTANSTVAVVVDQSPKSVTVSPAGPTAEVGSTLQFAAAMGDQFDQSISSPPAPSWSVSGGGSISSSGLFSASAAGGPFTVTATVGGVSGSTTVTVVAPITIGVTTVLGGADSGNGNVLIAQRASLVQPATIQSLSFYVTQTGGSLTLGIYDAGGAGGGPGALIAHTASFAPAVGWNTQPVTAQATLSAGTYWLSYLPSNNSLAYVKETSTGAADWRSFTYGPMPNPFGTPQTSNSVVNWSLYATLAPTGSGTPALTSVNVSPSKASVMVGGTAQFTAVAYDQNGTPMATQPTFAWTVTGSGNAISTSGLFTAGSSAGGPFTVTAKTGSVVGSAQVNVTTTSQLRLAASSNHRYLVNASGTPFLLVGDAPHDMFANISVADAQTYLQDRASRGFNLLWCEVIVGAGVGGRSDGSTYDGIVPFTKKLNGGQYDLKSPNPAYFSRVDQMINLAASYGMVILLDVLDNDSWLSTFEANGNAGASSWGKYLGGRYASFPNVVWITGNDFQTWSSSSTDNALAMNIMAAIASSDSGHLQTTELNYNISGSLDDSALVPYTTLAGAYSYYPSYYEVGHEYNSSAATAPVFLEESYYEGGSYGNLTPTTATNLMLRKVPYWTVLSGGLAGYAYGTSYYDFHSGWQTGIDTVAATQLGYWKSLMTSVAWYNLVPDASHSVVTAGYGTATGQGAGNIQTDNYVTTARTPDGALVMSYCPASTTLTVNMTSLSGTARARWYDPTNGTFRTISGSAFANTGTQTFATPGNNSSGDPDWVLVLQSP